MNTIPSTFKRVRLPYTVVGGRKIDKKRRKPDDLSLLLINRGNRLFKADILQELEKTGIPEIISVEGPVISHDIENLSGRFPFVKFLLLHQDASTGEQVNLGIEEAHGRYIIVLWNDVKLSSGIIIQKLIERVKARDILCSVPVLLNSRGEAIPSIQAPAFYKKHLKVVPLQPSKDGMDTLFPFDFIGVYSKERFVLTGGYDHNTVSPFWQKMDFGFRAHMWGEKIKCDTTFRIAYMGEVTVEDTTPDESYKYFFLKNLSIRYNGEAGVLPFSRFFPYFLKSGEGFFTALKEFREVRRWVRTNRFRFKKDARSVTELWEIPEI